MLEQVGHSAVCQKRGRIRRTNCEGGKGRPSIIGLNPRGDVAKGSARREEKEGGE